MDEPLPEEIARFIAAAVVTGDLVLPYHYPAIDELAAFQIGYRSHGLTGESLVSCEDGGWQPGWLVIAQNYFGDPFFIDTGEGAAGFPVHYAPHGAGRWDAITVAPSCREFGAALAHLQGTGDADALEAIISGDPDHPLWREAIAERRERAEDDAVEPAYDPRAIEQGDLIVTDLGPHKMKVIRLLREVLGLSLQDAMALSAQPDILVGSGPRVSFGWIERDLIAQGASVTFRPQAGDA
ncbi:hypothetical protein GRI97_11510 [Altererythrobacter xixiisoli]|uniref:Ribosomal protein L7/L12 C-terminal domain-containing protein n=1 Tax=Croceibacterium xixiisoli TaxID=1476466 RepID=A0A6I4TTT9_9SPHN|nr:SMI1/KNR4 family protein [Croceibacterium xixiisoli]MXO99615.1 hypothetical protein [Croceibacterium xixiisoli]